jgi:hypothetical protein
MRNVIIWLLMFIPALVVELLCYLLNPVAAILTTSDIRTDRVKREPWNNGTHTLDRDYLIKPLRWFQTHDNAVDEWWYGAFNKDSYWKFLREATQEDYDNSWWIRYLCRVHWMYRNNAYGFLYNIFGKPVEEALSIKEYGNEKIKGIWYRLETYPSTFKLEFSLPIYGIRYLSVNIGWKAHKGFAKKLYANRIIGFRKYKV